MQASELKSEFGAADSAGFSDLADKVGLPQMSSKRIKTQSKGFNSDLHM